MGDICGHSALSLSRSARTEPFKLVRLYSEDCQRIAGCSADAGEKIAHTLFKSSRIKNSF